jgi:putative transposase
MVRVYRYLLRPTRAQTAAMFRLLELLRELYNGALQERRDAWVKQHQRVSAYGQMRQLVGIREDRPEFASIHVHLLQDAITRVDRAFAAFFRRCKTHDGKPGYPRFKGRGRYRTFVFKDAANRNGAALVSGGKRVRLAGIGNVRFRQHRPIEGRIKQVSVTLAGDGHWYVAFICDDVPAHPLPPTGRETGVDLGISCFVALADGTKVCNPRPFETVQKRMARSQRRVSRRKSGSQRRRKAVALFAKLHHYVAAVRREFHHNVASALVQGYDCIVVEDLQILGLSRGMLAKQVHDAGWGQFLAILHAKAESAGRENPAVDPTNTSQDCSNCGERVHKDLSVRIHECPYCGYVADRDVNSARNVLQRMGRIRRGEVADVGLLVDPRSPCLATF